MQLLAERQKHSLLCVGLDSDYEKLPDDAREGVANDDAMIAFNRRIVDATAPFVCAFKPNIAFYEQYRGPGLEDLAETIEYIKLNYPDIPIILDAKRGDIGNTNNGYLAWLVNESSVDAITVPPYMGRESLEPFLELSDKGIFVLCRTSNPGSDEFQDLQLASGMHLYELVASNVAKFWNANDNCGLVAGVTYPEELAHVRAQAGDLPILAPGIGTQSNNSEEEDAQLLCQYGLDSRGAGLIINASRSVIFAGQRSELHKGKNFDQAAHDEAERLHGIIRSARIAARVVA